jgi:hypothetical protein
MHRVISYELIGVSEVHTASIITAKGFFFVVMRIGNLKFGVFADQETWYGNPKRLGLLAQIDVSVSTTLNNPL